MTGAWSDLRQVSDALYMRSAAQLQEIAQQEARLRQQLALLDAQKREAGSELHAAHAVRATGADTLWRGWLGRSRADLQMKLANTLVRKAHVMKLVRHSFGRRQVIEEMADAEHRRWRQDRAGKALLALLERENL